jgi:hypothetical protein
MSNLRLFGAAIALLFSVISCGGGGGGGSADTSGTAEGLWRGTTGDNREVNGLVLDNGQYWLIYSVANNPLVIAGAIQGNGSSSNGVFTSSDGLDANFEGLGVQSLSVNANYTEGVSLSGTATYASGGTSTFTSTYDSDYDLTPSLSTLAGTYSGQSVVTPNIYEPASFSVSSSGAIVGSGTSGCSFTGTAAPRSSGNVYNITVTFGGGVCALGTSTVTGIAYYDAATDQLVTAGLNSARTIGFIFLGEKRNTAEGLWRGVTGDNREINGVVLDDGVYWLVYSAISNPTVIAGAIQGNSTSSGGVFSSTNGLDFNFEGLGVLSLTVNGNYTAGVNLSGTASYTIGATSTFTSTYDSDYDLTPDLAIIAGTYTGSAIVSGVTELATFTVSNAGAITGSGASGCTVTGTVLPRTTGNVYDVSVTFGGGVCLLGTSTVNGIAYFDAGTNQITSAALNNTRTDGYFFVGTK